MKARVLITAAALLGSMSLTGCAEAEPVATPAPSVSPAAPSSAAPSPSTAASQDTANSLVTFTRTGGLAGTNDRLVVKPDGSWTLQSKSGAKEGKLTAGEVTALKAAFEGVGFSKLPKVNDGGNVADGYTYTINYGGDEVMAKDGAVPAALQPIISQLNTLLS